MMEDFPYAGRYDPNHCQRCGNETTRFDADHPVNFLINQFWEEQVQKVFRKRKKLREAFIRHCPLCNIFFVDYIAKDGRKHVVAYQPSHDLLKSIQAGPEDCPECLKPAIPLPKDDPRQYLLAQHREEQFFQTERQKIVSESLLFCEPCNVYISLFQLDDGTTRTTVMRAPYDLRHSVRYDSAVCQHCGKPAFIMPPGHPMERLVETARNLLLTEEQRRNIERASLRQCISCLTYFVDFRMRDGSTIIHAWKS